MKNVIYYILVGLFVISPLSANATSVYPSSILISPTPQTTNDFLVAEINGYFASPGYTLNTTSLVNTGNNNFYFDFDFSAPTGIALTVLDPFSYSLDLGVLDAGDYSMTAYFYVDSLLDNTIGSTFTVKAVPIPAAIWLFFSGIISLFAYGIKSKNA